MESHLTLNLNDGTVFLATVSTIASELRGTFMLNSTEMFFTLLLNPFSNTWLKQVVAHQQTPLVVNLFGHL